MKVKILDKSNEKISFILEGATPAFANALRRTMISEVPVLAVNWLDVHDNSSILFDEIIASRVGLLPLKFSPDKFVFSDECKCAGKGCPLCRVVFALEKNGPGIAYSGDLKSSNKEVAPISPDFPIVELLKNHNVRFEATAQLGRGLYHAKFQAANAAYQYFPIVEVENQAKAKEAIKHCPKGVLALKNGKIEITDPAKCDLCLQCAEASEGALRIKGDSTRFIFSVETISGLKPQYIIIKAAQILGEKAETFRKELAKL